MEYGQLLKNYFKIGGEENLIKQKGTTFISVFDWHGRK